MLHLSSNYGVNPSIDCCFVCGKDTGLVLFGRVPASKAEKFFGKNGRESKDGEVEAPLKVVSSKVPCDECKDLMTNGIILISVDEKLSTDKQNPYRTGGWVVVKELYIKRIITTTNKEILENILNTRIAFIPDEVWDALGLPRVP